MDKRQNDSSSHIEAEPSYTFFRLCHSCNFLNEADHEIFKCAECGAEFLKVTSAPTLTTEQAEDEMMEGDHEDDFGPEGEEESAQSEDDDSQAIQGLRVIW